MLTLFTSAIVSPLSGRGLLEWVFLSVSGALLCGLLVAHTRVQRAHRARLRDSARREGATLTARAVRHHLGNTLAITVGYSELLAEDPRLPEDLGGYAQRVKASALAAAELIDKLRGRVARVEVDQRIVGPPMLDLDMSIEGKQPAAD